MNRAAIEEQITNSSITEVESRAPNMLRAASFFVRSNGLRALRVIKDSSKASEKPNRRSAMLPVIVAESATPLRYVRRPEERVFEEGKIKNLRLACDHISGLVFEPRGEFSFWRSVGRPSRANGFVIGREIREGCLIPTVGGGLCQLSGSLYSVATQAGLTVLERHGHTRRLQDVYFDETRDATIFWNYVDLRFRCAMTFQLEAFLTDQDLVVRVRAERQIKEVPLKRASIAAPLQLASDCLSCGQGECHQSQRTQRALTGAGQMVLADRLTQEFRRFLQGQLKGHDLILSPAELTLFAAPYGSAPIMVKTFPWTRLRRSALSRLGIKRKIAAWVRISGARLFADCYAREICGRAVSYLYIDQELLPHLWLCGALANRKYCVLATRLPSSAMQRRLDSLYVRNPDRGTLSEFRMDTGYCEAEDQALAAADRIVSPHSEVVQAIPRCEALAWESPIASRVDLADFAKRDAYLFPAVASARDGAYEVRAAALALGLRLVAFERNIEHPGFWNGVDITFCSPDSIPWDKVSAVVHPAAFISQPRIHLRAIASGIPVLASPGCGLPPEQTINVELGSTEDLISKIRNHDRSLDHET